MKVLSIGGGAREHAIVKALVRDETEVYSLMKNRNPGIARLSKGFTLAKETDIEKVMEYARKVEPDIAVIGPEAPLGEGIVDALDGIGIGCVGPTKAAAQIEISKEYMRDLMKRHDLPGRLEYGVFDDLGSLKAFLDDFGENVVVKPIGLTGGKGAKVYGEHLHSTDDILEYAREIIESKLGGSSRLVVEERAEGEEFTLQCFCDGNTAVPMPAVQDHKRAYEGDEGPNTGGMGSYSQQDHLLPFLRREEYEAGLEIVQRTIDAMREEGAPYKGVLYGQFMLTSGGPRVIEFNARFGDPEAMNVLPLLESSFTDVCARIVEGSLARGDVTFSRQATVCKYVVPEGYGVRSLADQPVEVDEAAIQGTGGELFYASVNERDGGVFTTSSRSLAVVGRGPSIESAEEVAELGLAHIRGRVFMRHDIGKPEAIEKKVRHMEALRGGTN